MPPRRNSTSDNSDATPSGSSTPASNSSSKSNNITDRYTVKKEIGSGSFGVVHLCVDKETKEEVIVKTIAFNGLHDDVDLDDEGNPVSESKRGRRKSADGEGKEGKDGKREDGKRKKNTVLDFALTEVEVLKSLSHAYIVK
jgi:serine/threonine protein kinase